MKKIKYLIFEADGEFFGVEIKYVLKIKDNTKYFELPYHDERYTGLIQFENKFIPVYNFRGKNKGNAVIFIRYRMEEFALFAENIYDIYEFSSEEASAKNGKDYVIFENKETELINLENLTQGGSD